MVGKEEKTEAKELTEAEKKNAEKKEKFDNLQKRINKQEKSDTTNVQRLIATREIIERDYKEDIIIVPFKTSTDTERAIEAYRATNDEIINILKLVAQANKFQSEGNPESLVKTSEIYEQLHRIAAKLCKDKAFNEEFWSKKTSNFTLQSFINAVINESSRMTGYGDEKLKSFRK